jgi:hypothetical protein
MCCRWSIIAVASLVVSTASAAAAELPVYEVLGFPLTPHQLEVLAPANATQWPSPAIPTIAGMPASPLQIAVLTPRTKRMPSGRSNAVQASLASTTPPGGRR